MSHTHERRTQGRVADASGNTGDSCSTRGPTAAPSALLNAEDALQETSTPCVTDTPTGMRTTGSGGGGGDDDNEGEGEDACTPVPIPIPTTAAVATALQSTTPQPTGDASPLLPPPTPPPPPSLSTEADTSSRASSTGFVEGNEGDGGDDDDDDNRNTGNATSMGRDTTRAWCKCTGWCHRRCVCSAAGRRCDPGNRCRCNRQLCVNWP